VRAAAPAEDQVEPIAGLQVEARVQAVERPGRVELEVEFGPARALEVQAVPPAFRLGPAPGLDRDPQADRPLEHFHPSEQFTPGGRGVLGQVGPRAERHGIGDADQARAAAQLGHQDPAVGLVAVTGLDQVLGGDGEGPAPGSVEHAAEQRRGVEPRDAQPGDGTVPRDEGGGRPVADEAVVFDGEVAVDRAERCERRHLESLEVGHRGFPQVRG